METLHPVEDLARLTSVTTRTIRNCLRDGQLKGRKLGGQWRFTQRDVDRFLQMGAEAARAVPAPVQADQRQSGGDLPPVPL